MKKRLFLFILMAVCILSGCTKDNQEKQTDGIQASEMETNDIWAELPQNIEVCLEDNAFPSKVAYWEVGIAELDIEQVKEIIFPEITKTYPVRELAAPYSGVRMEGEEDGFYLLMYGGAYGYISGSRSSVSGEYMDIINARTWLEENKAEGEELEFASLEEVEKRICTIYQSLFPDFELQDIKIEGYDVEYLKELQEMLLSDENEMGSTTWHDWQEGMDVYYFKARIGIEGIPFNDETVSLMNETEALEWFVEGLMDKQGIVNIGIVPAYQVLDQTVKEIISYQEALLGAVAERYGNTFAVYQDKITDVKLEYMILPESLTGKMYTIPVWIFTREFKVEKEEEVHTLQKEVRVNAITGKLVE